MLQLNHHLQGNSTQPLQSSLWLPFLILLSSSVQSQPLSRSIYILYLILLETLNLIDIDSSIPLQPQVRFIPATLVHPNFCL